MKITLDVTAEVGIWLKHQKSIGNLDIIFNDMIHITTEYEKDMNILAQRAMSGDTEASILYLQRLNQYRSDMSDLGDRFNGENKIV